MAILSRAGSSAWCRCPPPMECRGSSKRPAWTASRPRSPARVSNLSIVPIASLNLATLHALAYAASLRQPALAVHVSPTEDEAKRFRECWQTWGDHVPLEVVESPYRAIVAPTVAYIESLRAQRPQLTLTVIVPELVVRHWWQRALHDRTAVRLRRAKPLASVVVTSLPFHLQR